MRDRPALRRGALLALVAFAAFLPALWAGFAADDFTLFRTVHHYAGLHWAFGRNDAGEAGSAGHFYRPLWVIWNAGLFNLFYNSQVALHAASLGLFAVIAIEVWALARRLIGPEAAWVPALAFELYPRHGKSVAWISGNTDLTSVALGSRRSCACLRTGRSGLGLRLFRARGLQPAAARADARAPVRDRPGAGARGDRLARLRPASPQRGRAPADRRPRRRLVRDRAPTRAEHRSRFRGPGGRLRCARGLAPYPACSVSPGSRLPCSASGARRAGSSPARSPAASPRQAIAIAPKGSELILLTSPESYRNAHVYPSGDMNSALSY